MSFSPSPNPPEPPAEPRPRATIAPLSASLIVVCVIVATWSNLGKDEDVTERFFISLQAHAANLPEVRAGQVWRLLTPIFLHFGFLHILFNMMWLKDLGTAIERVSGVRWLLALVVLTGIGSNLAQYYASTPSFGGMSGVVYAMFGFVWMLAKVAPQVGYVVSGQTVFFMLAWFGVCFTGAVGPIANYAHGAGLLGGIVLGLIAAHRANHPPIQTLRSGLN